MPPSNTAYIRTMTEHLRTGAGAAFAEMDLYSDVREILDGLPTAKARGPGESWPEHAIMVSRLSQDRARICTSFAPRNGIFLADLHTLATPWVARLMTDCQARILVVPSAAHRQCCWIAVGRLACGQFPTQRQIVWMAKSTATVYRSPTYHRTIPADAG